MRAARARRQFRRHDGPRRAIRADAADKGMVFLTPDLVMADVGLRG
jgi:hypothetical protein